jgi:hypothetical protein
MSLSTMLIHNVWILSPGQTISNAGDVTESWDTPTRIASKAWFSPSRSYEDDDPLSGMSSNESVFFLPAGADIKASDRIEWGERTYEVIGPAREQWTPRGEHHLEVTVKEFESQSAVW